MRGLAPTLRFLLGAFVASTAALAQGAPTRVPVKVIEGRLVVTCEVSTSRRTLPINLFVDYDAKCGLQLHNQVAAGLRCENEDGSTIPITVRLGEFSITVPRREHGDQDFYDDFTKYHSVALGENAAAGTLGSEILAEHFVVFDLANGFLYLGEPRAEDPKARDARDGQVVVPLTDVNGLAWTNVRFPDGSPSSMAIATSRYDSLIAFEHCDRFRKPAGDVESLQLADVDVTEFVALRPSEINQVHPNGVAGMFGLNFLEHFRVEVDRVNRVARFSQTAAANFPTTDLEFFRALARDDSDELAAFLEKHPDARVSREAAEILLSMRLDEDAEPEDCELALQRIHDTYPEDLRATAMLDEVKALREIGRSDLAVIAGRLGIPAGRTDRYPNSVHKLHAQVGEVLLDGDDRQQAWEHLLSAAFGMPEDGLINYHLGRFYEAEGRLRRAYSRYVQAVIKPDSGPKALEALHRLQGKMSGSERMSVDTVEKLTAGKTHAFGAATTYRPEEGKGTNRVALVEFFTNANLGDATRGGAIGGALGNDGLVSHFTDEHAAFITWHLPQPELVPMVIEGGIERAQAIQAGPMEHRINGVRRGPGAAKWRDKEKVYNECRKQVVAALAESSKYDISIDATVKDGELLGSVDVNGPADSSLYVQVVLVERGVMFPGRSEIVIHRNVARALLTDSSMGERFEPGDESMRLPFATKLDDVRLDNEEYLDFLVETGSSACPMISMSIDPAQVGVVAFLHDPYSGEVLQARQVRAVLPEEDAK